MINLPASGRLSPRRLRRWLAGFAAGMMALIFGPVHLGVVASSPQALVVFTDVSVVPMDRPGLLPDRTVVVRNGVARSCGSAYPPSGTPPPTP